MKKYLLLLSLVTVYLIIGCVPSIYKYHYTIICEIPTPELINSLSNYLVSSGFTKISKDTSVKYIIAQTDEYYDEFIKDKIINTWIFTFKDNYISALCYYTKENGQRTYYAIDSPTYYFEYWNIKNYVESLCKGNFNINTEVFDFDVDAQKYKKRYETWHNK